MTTTNPIAVEDLCDTEIFSALDARTQDELERDFMADYLDAEDLRRMVFEGMPGIHKCDRTGLASRWRAFLHGRLDADALAEAQRNLEA